VESSPNLPVSPQSLGARIASASGGEGRAGHPVLALISVVGLPFGLGGAEVGIGSPRRVRVATSQMETVWSFDVATRTLPSRLNWSEFTSPRAPANVTVGLGVSRSYRVMSPKGVAPTSTPSRLTLVIHGPASSLRSARRSGRREPSSRAQVGFQLELGTSGRAPCRHDDAVAASGGRDRHRHAVDPSRGLDAPSRPRVDRPDLAVGEARREPGASSRRPPAPVHSHAGNVPTTVELSGWKPSRWTRSASLISADGRATPRGLTVVDDQQHPHGRPPRGSGLGTFAPDVDT
jgi:hypothetical protein